MAQVTFTLDGADAITPNDSRIEYTPDPNIEIPASLTPGNSSIYLILVILLASGQTVRPVTIDLALTDGGPSSQLAQLNDDFETGGLIQFIASNGESIIMVVRGGQAPPYNFIAADGGASSPQLVAFFGAVVALSDRTLVVTFDDGTNSDPEVTIQAQPHVVNANGVLNLTGTVVDPDIVPDTLALALSATPNIGAFSAITVNGNNWSATWTAPAPMGGPSRGVVLKMTATEPDESLTGSAQVSVSRPLQSRADRYGRLRPEQRRQRRHNQPHGNRRTDPELESMDYRWLSDVGGDFGTPTALTTTWVAPTVTESTTGDPYATRATDASGAIGTSSVTVIVRPPTSLPLMLPVIPNKTDATGDSVSETLPEAIQGLAPFIYSATGLPTGLRLRNRVIEGIPLLPGAFTVSYVVTDSNQDLVTRTFTWTITGMPVPQPSGLNLRIDWGDQFYASPHSDVTGHVTSDIECERGKNTASAILGRSQAGTLTCELQNSDGLFDDENINSPLLGLIRPGIQVQLRHGVTPLWTGVLDSIPTRFEQNGQHRATVNALGVLSDSIDPIVTAGSLTPESTAQAFIETCTKADLPYESPQPMPGDAYVMQRWWERARARHIFDVLGGNRRRLYFRGP